MQGQGLLDDTRRRAGPAAVRKVVKQLGFVQLDSIHVIERAHHLTLLARLDDYRHAHLDALYKRRWAFEHWTHDASLLPIEWHAPWHHVRRQWAEKLEKRGFLTKRLGADATRVLDEVLARIDRDGPLQASDFEHDGQARNGGWWNWKPAKAALEFLYWRGDLCVVARPHFRKVYDLTERHVPPEHRAEPTSRDDFARWAVAESIGRLNVATAAQVRQFLAVLTPAETNLALQELAGEKHVQPVRIGSKSAYAIADWPRRLAKAERHLARQDDRLRLLAPFDPVVRDRKRLLDWFGFDYRFEAFTPAPDRRHGYYTLPILRGETFVGRIDLKHERRAKRIDVRGVWWEPSSDKEPALLDDALARLARFVGSDDTSVNHE